jgi:ribosomal protein S18 acetylase RimI-like enzyme
VDSAWLDAWIAAEGRPATDPLVRRCGVARAVLGALADWSRQQCARDLYLQVERDNAPAQALYASLGFTRSHGYHFRTAR